MFDTKKIKNYNKLGANTKKALDIFLKRFYSAWEFPEEHTPIAVNKGKGFLRVDLKDGSWLHVKPNGEWYWGEVKFHEGKYHKTILYIAGN